MRKFSMSYVFAAASALILCLVPVTAAAQGVLFVQGDKVGVGTDTPEVPLHVVKTTAGNANMFRVDNNGAASFEFRNTQNGAFWFFQADQDGTFKVSRLGTGGSEIIVNRRQDANGVTMFVDGSIQATNVTYTSARDRKTEFSTLDRAETLEKLAEIPIESWQYKTDKNAVRHVGPTAEDFHGAFGLGGTDSAISVVDATGIALVAIQALHDEVSERDERIADLEQDLSELKALVFDMTE